MATLLCIETSTDNCSVAIASDDQLLCCREACGQKLHATELNNFIAGTLSDSGIGFSNLNAVVVGKGPGSYTGLRIGTATAKGICYALDIPLISVGTLEAMQVLFRNSGLISDEALLSGKLVYIPMLDARRNEVYCAIYSHMGICLQECHALILNPESFIGFKEYRLTAIGPGAAKAKNLLNSELNLTVFPTFFPSAKGLATIGYGKFRIGQFEDVAYYEPSYLKEFIAKPPRRQR